MIDQRSDIAFPVKERRLFYGPQSSPLLAPRGICSLGDGFAVADTGQNRVFLWKQIPEEAHALPDVTLGQLSAAGTGRNAGDQLSASSLQYPSGLWSDGKKLIVADAWNHRVLIWHRIPTYDGQPADVVLGQEDFYSNLPNVKGIQASPSASSLYWPYGLHSDGVQLWVADTGNRRVLYFEQIPTANFAPAQQVCGQINFTQKEYNPDYAIWPYSVHVSERGELLVTDTAYYRVLYWKKASQAFTQKADVVFGQKDHESNGQNQHMFLPRANTLSWCYDAKFDTQGGFWLTDTGNSRLLYWKKIADHHNSEADALLGQDHFELGSENKNSIESAPDSFYWPFSIALQNDVLLAADTGNHRIVIHTLKPYTSFNS
ncbi:hypothetical protein WJR50_20610 [Catalinimonas sp. 4WD22]|uniref:hypothetical protein n=1 Tax=Catalinimonas locisalis TaxID=3133978 RepID=UPI00310183E8